MGKWKISESPVNMEARFTMSRGGPMSKRAKKAATQKLEDNQPKMEAARQLGGIFDITSRRPRSSRFTETARNELEKLVPPACHGLPNKKSTVQIMHAGRTPSPIAGGNPWLLLQCAGEGGEHHVFVQQRCYVERSRRKLFTAGRNNTPETNLVFSEWFTMPLFRPKKIQQKVVRMSLLRLVFRARLRTCLG